MNRIKINLKYVFLCFLIAYSSDFFAQNMSAPINKIIITKDSCIYFSSKENIFKINPNSNSYILKSWPHRRRDFNDFPQSINFIISNGFLITLLPGKENILTNIPQEYWYSQWKVDYNFIDINDLDNIRIIPSILRLDDSEPLNYSRPIFFDLFIHEDSEFLLLLSDYILYVYKKVEYNNWSLVNKYSDMKSQAFFRVYKDDTCNIILSFNTGDSYCYNIVRNTITVFSDSHNENECLVYNYLEKEFVWIQDTQAKELLSSNTPLNYLEQIKSE